ncbi:M15 family metallopeptidase [Neobacillus sp. PS3-40]|uniref:M15 family metallopeptidase n=1 Tax=Neobacillus sp. PS3-40 TaxID=3070679 RepID=UPI0027E04DA9|nr:M15 family metallopeptidase [Neobacillus sp. PS3-40]WML44992.1 M15 family metallopeptidase [Neobacillus sp. PS3-40]
MKLRNILLILVCLLLFTGCSRIDSYLQKVPFLSKDKTEKKVQQENQSQIHKKVPVNNNSISLEAAYFNDIKQDNGRNVIQNPANTLALVNKNYALPTNYIPGDLVRPNVPFSFGDQKLEKSLIRKEAATALEKMFAAAKDSGIELYAVSGYRSYSRQKTIFDAEINKVGEKKAVQAVALPGSSEHQTGLAMDVASLSTNLDLTEGFASTKEGKWIAENAHKFGFILRYPKGKEGITIYEYEPWHFRYVGVKAATIIYKHNWTLEEFFNEVKKI